MFYSASEFRAVGFLFVDNTLLADAGVPMIFVQRPLIFCALLPVILCTQNFEQLMRDVEEGKTRLEEISVRR
jgi:hypothetical protein